MAHKRRFRPSDSLATSRIPPLSFPKKMHTYRSSSNRGPCVADTPPNLPLITHALSGKALHDCVVTSDLALASTIDSISSTPEAPPASSEAIVCPTAIRSDSVFITTKPIPSGSTAKGHLRRGELEKIMFRQRLFNAFAPQASVLTSDPPVSTVSLVVTPVVPLSTKDPSDSANVINLDSLIPDMDARNFDYAGSFHGSSSF
ncbi:unnamed protein product [Lactuca virosa]|uniref:Uncharacterized protein n=1 Tax=Lactuca virosa TaxID=75947 RepID=A0AAU9PSV3_9ASTR|nr:unnamed protein product [Lactuca virosa]